MSPAPPQPPRAATGAARLPDSGSPDSGEDVLARRLTPRQLSMIALGGAIGTGLFLGSGIAIPLAGPGVVLSYLVAAFIALVIAWALAEMAVAHPVAGSFGVYAEIYLHPWAGFTMRYSYWFAQVIAIGSEVVAAAIYCNFWFPHVPGWVWVIAFSVGLVAANAWSVASFGTFEYWFALIKVVAIVLFLVVGVSLLFGVGPLERVGFENYTAHGGFLPHGWGGVVLALSMAVFSYLGVEVVAVTAGEAQDPKRTVPRALRSVFWRLGLFYVGGMALLVGLVPWGRVGLDVSPFVRAFEAVGLPAASGVMNFVVLTAALSSANTNLYLTSRMLFSLSRGGYAPAALGRLTRRGVPLAALLLSSVGMVAAVLMKKFFPQQAYLYMIGVAFFGGIFVWIMILVTHLAFRRARRGQANLRTFMPGFPVVTWLGLAGLAVVLMGTWFVEGLNVTLPVGLPWLGLLSLAYLLWRWRRRQTSSGGER
ncbi:amino acid permease [Acidobacteriia bacterium AH_259_A11_L15]|nr:amino acid permease [Acidobacteriia bacterium AH_259_A11_L15]